MHIKSIITSITVWQLIILVIGFTYLLTTCTSHPLLKASLAQSGQVLSKFKPLQVPRQFAFPGFQTTWIPTHYSMLIFTTQLLNSPRLGLDPTETSRILHLGPTGPSFSPISEDEYEIEHILKEFYFKGEHQYSILQHGFRLSEDCWIPLTNMGNSHELLKAWEDEKTPLWHSLRYQRDVS